MNNWLEYAPTWDIGNQSQCILGTNSGIILPCHSTVLGYELQDLLQHLYKAMFFCS